MNVKAKGGGLLFRGAAASHKTLQTPPLESSIWVQVGEHVGTDVQVLRSCVLPAGVLQTNNHGMASPSKEAEPGHPPQHQGSLSMTHP